MRMGPRYGRAPSLYVAAAGVQGVVTVEAGAIVGLRHRTAVTRAPKLNYSGWPRGRPPLRHSCPAGPGATVGPVDTGVPRSVRCRSALALDHQADRGALPLSPGKPTIRLPRTSTRSYPAREQSQGSPPQEGSPTPTTASLWRGSTSPRRHDMCR